MGKIKPLRTVCDAGPVIHLDELNCLDLLSDFQENILPQTVKNEIRKHRPDALKNVGLFITPDSSTDFTGEALKTMCRVFSLDSGETEALTIMEKNPEAMFLTDDASARLVAERMGFRVHGTIGLIIRAIRCDQRKPEQVLDIINDIPMKSSLYIKTTLLEEIKDKLQKKFDL